MPEDRRAREPSRGSREDRRRAALARLEADELVAARAGAFRTTRAWQGAMARAAFTLYQRGEDWRDLRLPIAVALAEHYAGLPDEQLADLRPVRCWRRACRPGPAPTGPSNPPRPTPGYRSGSPVPKDSPWTLSHPGAGPPPGGRPPS